MELVVVVVVVRNVVVVSVVCVVIVVVEGSDVVEDVDCIVVVESAAKFPVVIVDVSSRRLFALDVIIDVGDEEDEGLGDVSIVVVIFILGKLENSVFSIVGAVVVDVIFGSKGFTETDKNKQKIKTNKFLCTYICIPNLIEKQS